MSYGNECEFWVKTDLNQHFWGEQPGVYTWQSVLPYGAPFFTLVS